MKRDDGTGAEPETKVQVLEPSRLVDPKDTLTPADLLALLLLKDFITMKFPTSSPLKQVDAAYTYAELMAQRRSK